MDIHPAHSCFLNSQTAFVTSNTSTVWTHHCSTSFHQGFLGSGGPRLVQRGPYIPLSLQLAAGSEIKKEKLEP